MAKISIAKPAAEPMNTAAYVAPVNDEPVIAAAEPIVAEPVIAAPAIAEVTKTDELIIPAKKEETTNVTKITFGEDIIESDEPAQHKQQAAQPKLEDILKGISKEDLYKHLGLDEQTIRFDEYRKKGGDPYDLIKEELVDYTKLPDEVLLKNKLQEQYPKLSAEKIQVLYDDMYGQDDLEDDRANTKKAILAEAHAYEERQKKIQQQQSNKFTKIAQPATSSEPNQYEAALKQMQQNNEAVLNYIVNDEPVQNFLKEKKLKIDLGNGNFHTFEIDNAKHLLDIIVDNKVSGKYGNNAQGKPDTQLLLQLALFKANPQQFISGILEEGRSLSLLDELLKDGQNATPPAGAAPRQSAATNKKITATTGRIVPYGG